jgi:predicted lipid-binding transport protein (Tim44 family)
MKALSASLIALVLGALALADDAQAARLGGGRSLGTQRQMTAPQRQATPPAQQQQPAAAPQPAGNRWLGPLAGLAAGLGLGWLFAQGGFGSAIGVLLMALLAAVAVFALMRIFGRGRAQPSRMQYSGFGDETVPAPPPSQLPGDAAQPNYRSQFVPNIPSNFDVDSFTREAKRNFLRLQEANDRGDLVRLRQVTTQEMFDALKVDAGERASGQQTDFVKLDASLLELVTDSDLHWASVRFSGSIREDARSAAEPFEEIWNLCKPVNGSSGWLLAGIQQTH